MPDPIATKRIVFSPSGKRGAFAPGTTILDAARALGVDLDSVCGGRGICGRCQIRVSEGHFAKEGLTSHRDHLSPVSETEDSYARRRGLASDRRLGCCARLLADCVIDVPPDSQTHRQIIRKDADARPIDIDPVVHLHYIDLTDTPTQDGDDWHHVRRILASQWGLADLAATPALLATLSAALAMGKGKITVAVRLRQEIVAVWPGYVERAFGLAIDIGSTTLAGYLCDLADGTVVAGTGLMNPQIRYGEDLMSRVSYAMLHDNGAEALTESIRQGLGDLCTRIAAQAGIDPTAIVEVTLVGNPVMHHMALGLDAIPLGQAPFTLALSQAVDRPAGALGLPVAPGAYAYVLPLIAGHVGADTAGAILAEAPHEQDAMTLLVDVGTNAEIVLGNRQRLLAASSPTGPAFEGAQISCGQRAAPGAIERVRIDRLTLEPRFKIIGCDLWSDDPGFDEASRVTGVTGICGSGIIEVLAELFLAGIIRADGTIDGALSTRSSRIVPDGRTFAYRLQTGDGPDLRITQNDVRAIQLAKAALYAGARLLMDRMGIDQIDRILLAGGFGSHIDPQYAMILGLIPDCDLDHVRAVGNAAGTGARMALLNKGARPVLDAIVAKVEKIETALEPDFQRHFVDAMAFPHATAPFLQLSRRVQLPDRAEATPRRNRRRQR